MDEFSQTVSVEDCIKAIKSTNLDDVFTDLVFLDSDVRLRKKYFKQMGKDLGDEAIESEVLLVAIRNPKYRKAKSK